MVLSYFVDFFLFDFKLIDKNFGVINGGDIGFDKEEIVL